MIRCRSLIILFGFDISYPIIWEIGLIEPMMTLSL